MNWDGPILTDSGGYQIFSRRNCARFPKKVPSFKIADGTPAFISPEIAMEIQLALGSDIAMTLDECAPYPCEYDYAAHSAEMTTRWARCCKKWKEQNIQHRASNVQRPTQTAELSAIGNPQSAVKRQLVFGIVQGATFDDLRKSSAQAIVDLDFDGHAIGE